jgi:hypothetical protein
MLYWLLKRVLRRGLKSQRGILRLGELADLARADASAWFLTQEKARLEYLAAKEEYERTRTWRAFQHLLERFLQLQSTNAVIGSLINEHLLEQLVGKTQKSDEVSANPTARRCA